jgi:hypothetical protein
MRYKLDLVGLQKSGGGGGAMAPNLLDNLHFYTQSGMSIMN